MKTQNRRIIPKICIFAGIGLLTAAVVALILWYANIRIWEGRTADYVDALRTVMPEPQNCAPEERRDNTMPVLPLDGINFIGIVEIPRYGSTLPVCGDWGQTHKYPCQFDGSIYNRTLKIGATTQRGQYDFYRELSVGDAVYFTDMEGNCYTLEITGLRYSKHADSAALEQEDAALTLFIQNIYSFEYLIVSCNSHGS